MPCTRALATVSSARYLSVTIDDDLNWCSHIQHLVPLYSVCSLSRKAASRLGRHGDALSLQARRTWYLAMVQGKLCYAANSFYPALTAAGLIGLERSAKAGIRAVLRLHNPVATQPLRERLWLFTIVQLCRQKVLVFTLSPPVHCFRHSTRLLPPIWSTVNAELSVDR